MRVFIGIDVEQIKENLAALSSNLEQSFSRLNKVDKDNYHMTLAFIGEIEDPSVLYNDLAKIKVAPLMLLTNNIGIYEKKNGDIYYVDVINNNHLSDLQNQVAEVIEKHVSFERQIFRPHITLFRKAILGTDQDLPRQSFGETFNVSQFHVYQSHQVNHKLTYDIIKTFVSV